MQRAARYGVGSLPTVMLVDGGEIRRVLAGALGPRISRRHRRRAALTHAVPA
jgi:hypothetical protein